MLPKDWTIEYENNNSVWQGGKLHIEPEQETGYLKGTILAERLKETAYNAQVLDYLLEHQEEIPTFWKDKYICFWGTIYRYSGGFLYVRYLIWDGGRWDWLCHWLVHGFRDSHPAAVPASNSLETLPLILTINGLKYKRI